MYRKRKQGRLNRKVAHTGISLLHFPSALPEPALPPLLRTTLRAGGDTLSHLISFLYHRWCAVRPGASEAPRLRAETHSGVQARPYGRGISLMRRRKAAAEPGVAGGHFALRASRLHPHSSTGLRPWPPAESGEQGKLFFTTLFLVMVIIEWTDLVFAVDSIPAAFAISQDPFVIYTSNIFAILGLRAMFFLLEAVIHKFHHLQKGLSLVLFVIGAKMLLVMFGIHISSAISFAAVMACLLGSLLLSLLFPKEF